MWGLVAPLFRWDFWFNIIPLPFSPVFAALMLYGNLLFIAASIALAVIASAVKLEKDVRKFLRRLSSFCIWFGFVGLVLFGLAWLRVPILGMRLFLWAWVLPFGWWAWRLGSYWFIERPKSKTVAAERAAYEKWLPKPNR